MNKLPGYTKVFTIGSAYTEHALVGEVIIQEKVDGSQFRWGLDENNSVLMGSKNKAIHQEYHDEMFGKAVESVLRMNLSCHFNKDTYFFGEYLRKPKHNAVTYLRVPGGNIVLFDMIENGRYVDRDRLIESASLMEIDIIPEFYSGEVTVPDLKLFHSRESFLGGEKVEGIVIKNYKQTILIAGMLFPLFTKYVREEYRELNKDAHKKTSTEDIGLFIQSFKNENRWRKAMEHLRDEGLIVNEPKDIGKIIEVVLKDIAEEETENIKNFLYNKYIKTIKSVAVSGFPEWYKDLLLERLKEKT